MNVYFANSGEQKKDIDYSFYDEDFRLMDGGRL